MRIISCSTYESDFESIVTRGMSIATRYNTVTGSFDVVVSTYNPYEIREIFNNNVEVQWMTIAGDLFQKLTIVNNSKKKRYI